MANFEDMHNTLLLIYRLSLISFFNTIISLLNSLQYVIGIRYLQGISPFVTSLWASLFVADVSLLAATITQEDLTLSCSAEDVSLLVVHSLGVSVGSTSVSNAMLHIPINVLALILTLEIAVITCLQYTVLKDVYRVTKMSLKLLERFLYLQVASWGQFM